MPDSDFSDSFEEGDALSDINMTPFIDIMLVLLIIFMITTPLMLGGIPVNLPSHKGDPLSRPEKPVIISLNAENTVFIDDQEVSAENRFDLFKNLAQQSEDGKVYVRGDGEIKYARMIDLMGELGQAGFARVILVTQKKPDQPGNESEKEISGTSDKQDQHE